MNPTFLHYADPRIVNWEEVSRFRFRSWQSLGWIRWSFWIWKPWARAHHISIKLGMLFGSYDSVSLTFPFRLQNAVCLRWQVSSFQSIRPCRTVWKELAINCRNKSSARNLLQRIPHRCQLWMSAGNSKYRMWKRFIQKSQQNSKEFLDHIYIFYFILFFECWSSDELSCRRLSLERSTIFMVSRPQINQFSSARKFHGILNTWLVRKREFAVTISMWRLAYSNRVCSCFPLGFWSSYE